MTDRRSKMGRPRVLKASRNYTFRLEERDVKAIDRVARRLSKLEGETITRTGALRAIIRGEM